MENGGTRGFARRVDEESPGSLGVVEEGGEILPGMEDVRCLEESGRYRC